MEQPLSLSQIEDALSSEQEVNIIMNTTSNELLLKKIEESKYPLVRIEKFDVHGYFLKHNSFKVRRRVQSTIDNIFLATHYNEYENEKIAVQYLGPRKGYGIIAIDNIPENEVVCLYMGIISFKKPRGRNERVMEVDDGWKTYWIDGKRDEDSYSAFLNDDHINPNLEVRYIKPSMSKYRYPFFVSSRKILKNEELTYRYPGWNEDYWWRNSLGKYNSLKYNLRKPKLLSSGKNLQKILEYHVDNNITNDNSSFEIVDCNEKGKGVIAKRHFPKESFLMYYSGEEVEDEEVENDAYVYEIHINNKRKCIDAFRSKCYTRYLNDNNESPNVYVKPIAHSGNGKIYIVFVAKCDINPGDQLEYDYGGGSRNYDWRKKPKLSQDSKISCESNESSEIEDNVNNHGNSLVINEDSSASSVKKNIEKASEVETTHNTKSYDINEDENVLKSTSIIDKDKYIKTIPTKNNNVENTSSINKDGFIKAISTTENNVESAPSKCKEDNINTISTINNVAGRNSSIDKDSNVKTIPTAKNDVKISPCIGKKEYIKTMSTATNNNNNNSSSSSSDDEDDDGDSDSGNKIDSSMDSTTPAILYDNSINISESSGDEETWNMPPIHIRKEMVHNGLKNLKRAYFDSSKYMRHKNVEEMRNSSHVCPFLHDFNRDSEIRILENFRQILLDLFKLKKSNLLRESLFYSEILKLKFFTGAKKYPWESFSSEPISIFNFWEECRSLFEEFLKVKSFIKNFDSGNSVDCFPRCDDNFTLCPKFIYYLDLLENILKNQYHNFKIPFLSYERRVKYIFDIIVKQTKDLETNTNFENEECTNTDSNRSRVPLNVLKSLNHKRQESRVNENVRPEHMIDEEGFNKRFLEVGKWFEDMEKAINTNSCSLDIVDNQIKLKQHAQLEASVISYQDDVDAFKYFGRLLNTQKTCEKLNIASKIDILEKRYNALRKTVDDKKSSLEGSLKGLQMLSKLEDECIWIQKKEPFCHISSYGINLKRVSSLIIKHKALIDDLNVHEPIIKDFSDSLETLDAPSVIVEMISSKVNLINEKWLLLKSSASQRSIRLHYTKLVHQFNYIVSTFKKLFNNNENGFDGSLQDVEIYQKKLKSMDSLVVKIESALKKNKDLEKLDICKRVFISKDEDIENRQHPSLITERENDIDVIRKKHEEVKTHFGRLLREKLGT